MGCTLTHPTENTIQTSGKLTAGNYSIDGNVSSQFITGLLFATALLDGESSISINGRLESKPYVEMTQQALGIFGVDATDYHVKGSRPFRSPGSIIVEGDWSNAAFFLAAKALGSPVQVTNLDIHSLQGDRAVAQILKNMNISPTISVADIPDLMPILAVVFGATCGVTFTDIMRLRLKESDRVASVCSMLNNLGVKTVTTENTLTVISGAYHGCVIDAANDHRIAMAGAIAATVADGPIIIRGAECVAKSYPSFWQDYEFLGGKYE